MSYRIPLILLVLTSKVAASYLELIRVSEDGKGFVLGDSGRPFIPWASHSATAATKSLTGSLNSRLEIKTARRNCLRRAVSRLAPIRDALWAVKKGDCSNLLLLIKK